MKTRPPGKNKSLQRSYVWDKYVAIEIGYTHLGDADISRWAEADFNNRKLGTIDNWALDISTRWSIPIYQNAGVFTRLGAIYLISDDTFKWREVTFLPLDRKPECHRAASYNVMFGAGAYYYFNPCLRAEISWMRYEGSPRTGDGYQPDPDFFSFGISYRFSIGDSTTGGDYHGIFG